jgi:hypothetical protein
MAINDPIKSELDSDPIWTGSGGSGYQVQDPWFMFNFPAPVIVDRFGFAFYGSTVSGPSPSVEISNNSTDGLDGDWTAVKAAESIPKSPTPIDVDITFPTAATWLRIKTGFQAGGAMEWVRKILLYGEYDTPEFLIYDATGTNEITLDYQVLNDAPNHSDYHDEVGFTIKNNDSIQHSYQIEVLPSRIGGDSIIANYFTLSDDLGVTKVNPLTITDLAAGGFTSELRVHVDVLKADNPADGTHFFYVKVEEVA